MDILVMSHGRLAEGFKNALNIIAGDIKVDYINAYVEGNDFKEELFNYLNSHKDICILTDLFGGSVNQEIMKYISDYKIKLITGINLPLAIEIILENKNGELTNKKIIEIIENAKKQIMFVNEISFSNYQDDFD